MEMGMRPNIKDLYFKSYGLAECNTLIKEYFLIHFWVCEKDNALQLSVFSLYLCTSPSRGINSSETNEADESDVIASRSRDKLKISPLLECLWPPNLAG